MSSSRRLTLYLQILPVHACILSSTPAPPFNSLDVPYTCDGHIYTGNNPKYSGPGVGDVPLIGQYPIRISTYVYVSTIFFWLFLICVAFWICIHLTMTQIIGYYTIRDLTFEPLI